ncbi:hypothetical protein [Aliikangiella maris]|uniref:Uncharacterized protein n=2 Tax=Aliikangiella maris TaxID=3162458 RepID=A0ABV2BSA8_9GAMM
MKLYPYRNIKTENLKTLLIVTRALGILGYLLVLISVGLLLASFFMGEETITKDIGSGIRFTTKTTDYSGLAIISSIWSIASALGIIAISGLCAAVVSCEYQYTSTNKI